MNEMRPIAAIAELGRRLTRLGARPLDALRTDPPAEFHGRICSGLARRVTRRGGQVLVLLIAGADSSCLIQTSAASDQGGARADQSPGANPSARAKSDEAGETRVTNSFGAVLVRIAPGEFLMGSPESESGRTHHEGPQHRVRLTKTYYLGETEVTQAQWKSVMGSDGTPSPYAGDDLPVSGVTWQEAVDFCRKLSERPEERSAGRVYRLPTEAEWEFACRAGTSTPFSFGETIDSDQANYDADFIYGTGKKGLTRQRPCPCGSLPANAWGLREMHGNAWEWCSDFYSRDTYSARVDSANQVQVDPTGPPGGMAYVVRGGAWSSNPAEIRSASRTNYGPTYRQVLVGLRLCMDAP